ncbi:basement membrane-specific heparan sulfate proteoglycan core protein [Tribolium castaneum]|uniref:basement membrane-specific heparan sulfate proteoglycan core protein n=1 Tax=Tribolium castaneum TaxID=7070 RepID=UPI0030FE0402
MGAFGKDTPRLAWLCLIATFCFLILDHSVYQVSAESKVDSDLVFENLEQTDLANHENHHRIARDLSDSEEHLLESSPPVEEHWLSSTVNRIRRSINSLLSSQSNRSHSRSKRKLLRVPRQDTPEGQQEAKEDYDEEEEDPQDFNDLEDAENDNGDNEYDDNTGDNEYDEENGEEIGNGEDYNEEDGNEDAEGYDDVEQTEDNTEDEVPEEEYSPSLNNNETTESTANTITESPQVNYFSTENGDGVNRMGFDLFKPDTAYNRSIPETRNETQFGYDDEDNLITSGEGSTDGTSVPHIPVPHHPVYYRISFTVSEPYVDAFSDRNSFRYRDFSEDLIREIDRLYQSIPGTQSATVIKIEKREADAFTSKVTIDLGSDGYINDEIIKDVLYSQITNNHRLGKTTVLPEDFQFRVFEASTNVMCDVNEIPCHSGECVPSEARCNGNFECADHSDEAGCEIFAETSSTTTLDDLDLGSGLPDEGRSPESKCRADDIVRCADGSPSICADQVCDGVKDCADGGDEKNCSSDCAKGEISCDITRCIPESKRCDGMKDCQDDTDERDCIVCRDDEIKCDNKCIPLNKRCDGTADCSNRADELNCPAEAQCRHDEFLCHGSSQCIPLQQRCDGNRNCPNNEDETDCSVRCGADQFTCQNGACIPISAKCDSKYDCQDLSDERNCPCKPTDFQCNNGVCILPHLRCNGVHNCQDKSDEIGCPSSPRPGTPDYKYCTSDQFKCKEGTCISLSKRCDGKFDCGQGEDELSCALCRSDQFRCANGDCIDAQHHCDYKNDCPDGSDEKNCNGYPLSKCPEGTFECAAGFCIMGYKRCNGIKDCPSGNDEDGCPTTITPVTPEPSCASSEFRCNDGRCIDISYRCDDIPDCRDKSDEINCYSAGACATDEVLCNDGSCVSGKKCDRSFDCPDGSDESGCSFCTPDQFPCQGGGCIAEHLRCDGTIHCSDGSDERNCVFTCPEDQFRCGNGVCLDNRRVCDTHPDCPDGSDEQNCTGPLPGPDDKRCLPSQFDCGDSSCINSEFRCDGYQDCKNGRDEMECSSTYCHEEDEFRCSDGTCIPNSAFCDGVRHCRDGSDELDCPPPPSICTVNEFQCDNGECIPNYLRCDGVSECPDRSDERECQCRTDQFQCSNGTCIAGNLRCNRRNDCSDGSDEFNCPTQPPPFVTEQPLPPRPPQITCSPGTQPCHSGDRCILHSQFCDGRVDCNDMSDETNCQPKREGACSRGQFRCENGPCIREELRCDGKVDCPRDSSDELDCPTRYPGPSEGLNLRTYPSSQEIKENIYKPDREVVFQCRDEGPFRARVRWTRPNGEPLPPGSRDHNGRLEIPNIKVEHSGTYTCEAVGYPPNTPGAHVSVHLQVDRWIPPPIRPPTACALHEATCSNGDCIPKHQVCDEKYDCTDGSDENRCNPNGCEPNEFRCANKKCVLKTWRCDSDDDCGDGSDEENCATNPPGSLCAYHQFACHSNNQCIPRSYHCDLERDCIDGSDEIGCSIPVVSKPPPPMVNLEVGSTFEITCTAVGVPTPEIVWRLNWGHIPPKCRTTSDNGFGTLSCPNIQVEDQGAYSCEVINIKGTVFAIPDTILVINQNTVCPAGYFNEEARSQAECIKCFCFGQSTKCRSADLFIYHFQPPFDTLKLLGVRIDSNTGVIDIRDEPIYRNAQPQLTGLGRNGVHAQLPPYGQISSSDLVPYFAMPENYHGNQLKSYGGYLRFTVRHYNRGYTIAGPTVILTGNGYTLLSRHNISPPSNRDEQIEVRFFEGEWVKRSDRQLETPATREEIMMALAEVDNILIKLQYNEGPLNTTITNIEMDSAGAPNSGLGPASYVEECECPVGYSGSSCERCADGFVRHKTGPWLGQCYRVQPQPCPPGTYGDPSRGRPCEICPCPLTSPSNQFARTCSLGSDGEVTCDCPPGYVGRRCEQCAPGYSGNPLIPGDSCRASSYCNSEGTSLEEQGRCRCKDYVDGPTCDTCKANTFHLSGENQFGCIACFCMGVTRQCSSSTWFRDQISTTFTSSRDHFTLIDTERREEPITDAIRLDQNQREISYSSFSNPNVHYWSLPRRYLGNKIASYGGYLKYTLRYVPLPGGQISRNSAADVELVSANEITLLYYAREQSQPTGSPQTFVVPLLEQYWQRSDGQKADREHLLMALADLNAIYIKATYNTNTRESALISVSLDTANEYNTGSSERALAVEQCRCPEGYTGLSCEDCAVGYTRAEEGIYLGICEPCNCNGNSRECHPETGVCQNCDNFTTGDNCELCLPGYEGDPANGIPCVGGSSQCNCDQQGAISPECYNGICRCKTNVEGNRCNRCRPGTFGLSGGNIHGCQTCFCSGVATECVEGNLFYEQIPIFIDADRHGFTLTDQYQTQRIDSGFQIHTSMNEIGYTFRPSTSERWFWSLPREFTGNQVKSYGGRLEFTQRFTQRPQAGYVPDKSVIIIGNGITIYWTNPQSQIPDVPNKVSVVLNPSSNWQRLDGNQGPRPATREDIMTVLANIDVILINAQPSSDTESAYISDVTLDTAIEQNTFNPQSRAIEVEICRCPTGYQGTSCESCAPGFYRDTNDFSTGPLGSCSRCPCNNHEQSCYLAPNNRVVCNCLPGYMGERCVTGDGNVTTTPGPVYSTPHPLTMEITIVAPVIEIYKVGSTVRFNCSARSLLGPRPIRVTWTKDGAGLPAHAIDDGRGILVITNLKVSDSGRYICEATDGYAIESKDITVTVGPLLPKALNQTASQLEPPRVVITPPFVDVQEGQTVQIQCAATGTPEPILRLIRLDGQQLNPAHYFQNGLFRIPQAHKSDEGPYQCIATNAAGTHTSNVDIYVRENTGGRPVTVEISPPYYEGSSGETFSLRCQADRAIDIKWTRQNGRPLPYSFIVNRDVLTATSPRAEDSGVYVCTATSATGYTATGTADVTIYESSGTSPPSAKVSPERITISQGSSTELRCDATGSPTPTIKWTRVGSELPPHITQSGSVLYIRNAQVSDRGVYVCVSSNNLGLAQASSIVEVNRLEIPILSVHPQASQTVTAGNSAILACRVDAGIPAPTVVWTRADGRPLSPNIETMSHGTLRFTQITENEGGEYICTAENEAGRASVTANIEVQVAPEVWTVPDEDVIMRRRDEFVRLECHARGSPPPSLQWRRLSEPYGASGRSGLPAVAAPRNVAILEIARFSARDQDLYICEARNQAGVAEKRVQLAIHSVPSRGDIVGNRSRGGEDATGNEVTPPEGGYRTNERRPTYLPPRQRPSHSYDEKFTAPVGTRAELRCQINNNYDSEPIYVNWARTDNSSLPNDAFIRSGTLYIDNVQPSAGGEYRCLGTTSSGQVVFSVIAHLEVISPPRITLIPPRQVVRPGDNAYIQCSATGQQPITIRWVPVGRSFPPTVNTQDGLIQFNNIKLSDAGRYRCTAVNSAGEADAVADVIVEENVHKPSLTAENRQQTGPVGSTITLRCRAHDSSIVPNIRWFRERLPLPQNSQVQGEVLTIYSLQPQDEGRYYCEMATDGGSSSDYVDLHVTSSWSCRSNEWKCRNNVCIPVSQHCDTYDDCGDNSDEDNCGHRRRRGPSTVTVPSPSLHITPAERTYRAGEHVDLNCQSSEPGVITTWSKLAGWFESNVQSAGGTLRIPSVRPENSGTYRCEATGYQGVYHKDYQLEVIDRDLNLDEPPLEIKTAPQGSTVIMECKTDLEPPVSYMWTKQGRSLPNNVDVHSRSIQLNEVNSMDAGVYTCTQNNGDRKIDTTTVLTVTGIVPHFAQAPTSYIALENTVDLYIQFNFEISFKPQNSDGLLLYNGDKGSDRNGDFISLALVNGVPEFRFNLGGGVATVTADRPVTLNEWHTIKIIRYRKKVTMFVDGTGPFIGNAEGKYIGLDLSEQLYLGGVPDFDEISPEVGVSNGFVGCISRFKIGYNHIDITKQAKSKHGITTCETCSHDRCKNRGVCQEALSPEGYSCICTPGYSGPNCEKLKGEACSPYTCGTGRCLDNDSGFDCLCPMGRAGRRCEREISVNEPAFSNGAYIAYPVPKLQRRFKAALKIKPTDNRDGILLYCAETDEGHGDFVSLAIKDRHIEFNFNVGGRPVTIRSEKEVRPGEWHVLTATRSLSEGRLIVDGETTFGTTPGNHKTLNLLTRLYVGGYDSENIKINDKVGVHSGFNGCISEIKMSGLDLDVINSAEDSANVMECSSLDNEVDNNVGGFEYVHENTPTTSQPYNSRRTGCSSNPCKNGGQCYPLSPMDYNCNCLSGFSGKDCEIEMNICEQKIPCQNGGTCSGNATGYECSCPLLFSGKNCELRVELRNDAHFNGKGYLEFDRDLLDHIKENEDELIAVELSTNSSDGLVFWHGQTPNEDGQGKNYISLGVVNGYLEFSYDLGSGPAIIRNTQKRVDDGQRHSAILKRRGRVGSIEIDNAYTQTGESPGFTNTLSCAGNIYLGGAPNIGLMTGRRFSHGFDGCVHAFELQNLKTLDLGIRAISGVNVKPCSSFDDLYDENDLVN